MKLVHGGDVYRHPDVIDFSANINPLGTPRSVVEAAREAVGQIEHYPDVCCQELKKALADYEGVREDWICCGNGAAELIFSLVLAVRPRRALLYEPTFAEYRQALSAWGCRVETYYLEEEKGFQLGEDFLEQIKPGIDMVFLCNPNNPTGLLVDEGLLENILRKCRRAGALLVVDECFLDFVEERERWELKPYLESCSNLLLMKAFTKRYAMAGIRLGYCLCSNKKLLERMAAVTQPWNVSTPAQAAGVAALKEEAYVDQARELVKQERIRMRKELMDMGLKVWDSQANYLFFQGPEELYEKCLEKKIMVRDCSNYPGLTGGYYRIAVKMPQENDRLLEVLENFLGKGSV